MTVKPVHALSALLMLAMISLPACASGRHGDNDRVSVGSKVTIAEGESVDDIACAFCEVQIHGEVAGDVAVFWGRVTVDPGRTISGDVVSAGGDLSLCEGATVGGDLAMVGGRANIADGVGIRGDRVVIEPPVGTLILLSPLILLAVLIWLIVWLVRRNRYRFPRYPRGTGIPPMRG